MTAISNTLFIGKVLNYYDSALSTNTIASEHLVKRKTPEGSVFYTFNQTAGRGQYGNTWQSEPMQNIAVSIVLNPSFLSPKEQFHLNKSVALAIYDTLSHYILRGVSIKWANDIFINDKKACGVLIQNAISGLSIQSSIIGIGINVNQKAFTNLPYATSLSLEKKSDLELFDILEKLCQCLEKRYLQLKSRQFDKIHTEYLSKMFRYGEEALFQYPNGEYIMGKIVDVDDSGKLVIESKKGLEFFDIKEIKFVL